jgi:hypothetical protein
VTLLVLVDGLDQGETLHYKPGQGERFPVSALLSGVLTDPATPPVLTLHSQDGTTVTPSPVAHDGTGQYHADYELPTTAAPGVWVRRWTASGSAPVNDAVVENRFIVDAPDF